MNWNELTRELTEIGQEVKTAYKEGLVAKGAIATGKLYDSIGYEIVSDTNGIRLEFIALDYWLFVEEGRAKGKMPPVEVIKKWLISRGIPEKPGLAFVIARSIGQRGIKARPILRPFQSSKRAEWLDRISRAIEKDIKEEIKNGKNTKTV